MNTRNVDHSMDIRSGTGVYMVVYFVSMFHQLQYSLLAV